ncbi:multidrug effflux MFS transporter [Actinomycetospora termitidis]|uniref:Multidrug effflux MFS transporter n=1 Tax=Actinomycetospora termitidis TaxID=3053470 RepID=A0ABT7MBX5_9PSEU|nr:multidrug effflux MFS transporter [Actinomycetospora sp. Odt1-22]MDL5158168.1 multidrug effflux MFS transporter [Actinomycetospora sp. Odt1-22]
MAERSRRRAVTGPQRPEGSRRGGLARTAVLGALTAAAPLSIDTYLPALPAITVELESSASLVALTLTACVVGLAVGQLVAGPLSDVLGRRRPMIVGAVGFVVLSAACAAAPDVGTLVALRLGQGLFGAVGIVVARAVVRDLYEGAAAARAFAALMLVSGVAPIVAPVLGGQLLELTSWRGVFVVLAALGALVLVGVLLAVPETLPPERRRSGGWRTTRHAFGVLLADAKVLACVAAAGFGFAAMFAYISGSTFVLQGLYGLSPQEFSGVFAINSVGIVSAVQLSGRLVGAERVRPERMVPLGLAIAVVGSATVLGGALGLGVWGVVVGLFVTVCGVGTALPAATTLSLADHPEHAGSASALLGTAQFIVGGFAAPLVGLGGGRTALPMGLTMTGATLVALLTFTALWRRATRAAGAGDN